MVKSLSFAYRSGFLTMYKAIVSDLDGTLLNSQHRISAHTRQTLHRLTERGLRLIVATGRHHVDVAGIQATLGLGFDLVTSNGAVVHDRQGQMVFSQCLPADVAQVLTEIALDEGVTRHVYQGDAWYVENDNPEFLAFHEESGFSYLVTDLQALDKNGISKMFFLGEFQQLLMLEQRLQSLVGEQASIAMSSPICLEVMHKQVNKGRAVHSVLGRLGLVPEETIAFGDGMNDLEMLQLAGHGVLMGNAQQRLSEHLSHLPRTSTCDQDGVAEYLQKFFG